MLRCEVAVVGAGLAGLACARRLSLAGLDVHVFEGSDAVGGRVRTDLLDGFRLDRGFQVHSTAYPEAVKVLDYDRLDLRPFDRALVLRHAGRTTHVPDPFREPRALLTAARAPVGTPGDKLRLAAYGARAATLPVSRLRARPDVTAREAWREAGLSEELVDGLLRPFLAGVLLEQELETSRRFTDCILRMFARGRNAVPAAGMQAIPEQLAQALPEGHLHLDAPVTGVHPGGLQTSIGTVAADAVVVATDSDAAAELTGGQVTAPSWHTVTTYYHAAPAAPMQRPTLVVDAEPSPVTNSVVLTAAAPAYSGDGRALISTSFVPPRGDQGSPEESAVRERLATLYQTSTTQWEHLATYVLPRALPQMVAPHSFRKPVRLGDALYVCGDHRDTSSIQGALVSGRRAADAVLADLGRAPAAAPGGRDTHPAR